MAVPTVTVDATGIHSPTYPEVLAALQDAMRSIYGSDINLDSDSQDGQMVAVFAQAIYDTQQSCVATYNSFSPTTAQGAGLSSVVKINGLARHIPSNSQANLTLVGVGGTVITNGIVGDNLNLGTKWALPASVTIPLSGSIIVTATCTEVGSTSAAANTLVQILTPTFGWQSATNVAPSTVGEPTEDDATLRQRQSTSVSLAALTNLESIYAEIANVPAVTRLFVYENDTDVTDGNGIPAHSICAVVYGGDAMDIATAIALKKAPGTGTYGSTSEVIIDPHGVADTIRFYVLTITQLDIVVNIKALNGFATSTQVLIQEALAAYISGLGIGETSYYLRLVAPANLEGEWAVAGTGQTEAALSVLSETYTLINIGQRVHGVGSVLPADVAIAFNAAAAAVIANITVNVLSYLTMVSTPSAELRTTHVYSQANVASNGSGPYTYWYIGTLPAGTTINTATGLVSGTLTTTGAFSYTVTATDSGTPPQTISKPLSGTITT